MKTVIITRFKVTEDYSLGKCYIKNEDGIIHYVGVTLERGWRNNQQGISCMPVGEYDLRYEYSPHFRRNLWEVYGVPNRSEIKFHVANYWRQLNGCVALGVKHVDIDGDGDPDVTSSRNTLKKFHSMMSGTKAKLIVKDL